MPLRWGNCLWVVVLFGGPVDVVVAILCILRIRLCRSDTLRLEYLEDHTRKFSLSGRTINMHIPLTALSSLYEGILHTDQPIYRPGDGV